MANSTSNAFSIVISDSSGAYITSMADYEVRQMTSTYVPTNGKATIASVTPSEWLTSDPGNTNLPAVILSWSGGAKGEGTTLVVNGGGHADSANNGVYVFDYSGTSAPTGWTVGGLSAVSAVQNSATYSDGRPASVHTYDGCIRVSNKMYRFGGAKWIDGSFYRGVASFNLSTSTWAILPDLPSGVTTELPHVVYDPTSNKILYLPSGSGRAAFFRLSSETWGNTPLNPTALAYYGATAYDTSRGRAIVLGSTYEGSQTHKIVTPNWTNETLAGSTLSASGSTAILARTSLSVFYDSARDCFWIFGGDSGSPGYANIYEMNASTFAITAHALSSSMASFEGSYSGSYGRYVFMPTYRAIGFVTRTDAAPYVIKLPD